MNDYVVIMDEGHTAMLVKAIDKFDALMRVRAYGMEKKIWQDVSRWQVYLVTRL